LCERGVVEQNLRNLLSKVDENFHFIAEKRKV